MMRSSNENTRGINQYMLNIRHKRFPASKRRPVSVHLNSKACETEESINDLSGNFNRFDDLRMRKEESDLRKSRSRKLEPSDFREAVKQEFHSDKKNTSSRKEMVNLLRSSSINFKRGAAQNSRENEANTPVTNKKNSKLSVSNISLNEKPMENILMKYFVKLQKEKPGSNQPQTKMSILPIKIADNLKIEGAGISNKNPGNMTSASNHSLISHEERKKAVSVSPDKKTGSKTELRTSKLGPFFMKNGQIFDNQPYDKEVKLNNEDYLFVGGLTGTSFFTKRNEPETVKPPPKVTIRGLHKGLDLEKQRGASSEFLKKLMEKKREEVNKLSVLNIWD